MLEEYKNILVPVDGSEQSEESFTKAVAIAKRNHAVLYLVHIVDTGNISLNPEYDIRTTEALIDLEDSFLDKMVAFAEKEGVVSKKIVINGNPMTLIAETFPKELHADLIVIAATGKGALTRAVVGSVSNYVLRHAPCDVLLVRT